LGIGKAGGTFGDGSTKNSEAAMLADRLNEMRKARDERSKALKMESSVASAGNPIVSPVLPPPSVSAGIKSPSSNSNRMTKKKKMTKGK